MVKIRMSQTGTTNRKTYRIIVIDHHKRRDGKAIETLGYYDPLVKPAKLTIDRKRVAFWVACGAQLSERVSTLINGMKS